ncbi:MAG TPA: hypothetical protein PLP01_02165 [Phycisphaerae bacterium]|nr:hypothetical protein [Phycisphaerae bacterium]HOI54032.1 hypothetical protein [Phycisphaerae bacterium]
MAFMSHSDATPSKPSQPREADGLFGLATVFALTLAALLLAATFLADVSRQASVLTSPSNALAIVAAAWAFLILVVYPMWPGTLLGDGDPAARFGPWLLRRAGEVLMLTLVASPVFLAAAIFAGEPLVRLAHVLVGLVGTALAAVVYRLIHRACAPAWHGISVMDLMLWLFGPVVFGYLVLEHSGRSIGWGWLVSPPALARSLAVDGLAVGDVRFWVGLVGYGAVGLTALMLFRGLAARFRREVQAHTHDPVA